MAKKQKETEEQKKTALEGLMLELNGKYGTGTIIGGKSIAETPQVISTGSLTLNIATSIGGLPVGKLIEMFGPESSGKSTMALHFIAEFQKANKKCVIVDGEQSFDRVYASNLGVIVDDLSYVQAECQEDGYNIVEKLVRTGEVGLIVIDSHTAMVPKKIVDGEVGDATMALQARNNSIALLKIHPILGRYGCTIVSIAQLRMDIGAYGDPQKPTGGLAYKFYSDMRLKVSKILDKEKDLNKTTVEVVKNKCGIPFGKASFSIGWGKGILYNNEILDIGIENNIMSKSGSWYYYGKDKLAQGVESTIELFDSNPELFKEIELKVLQSIGLNK